MQSIEEVLAGPGLSDRRRRRLESLLWQARAAGGSAAFWLDWLHDLRSAKILSANGIHTWEDLEARTEKQVRGLRGMGPKTIRIIRETMTAMDRGFAQVANHSLDANVTANGDHFCGWKRSNGRPCKMPVSGPGVRCGVHDDEAQAFVRTRTLEHLALNDKRVVLLDAQRARLVDELETLKKKVSEQRGVFDRLMGVCREAEVAIGLRELLAPAAKLYLKGAALLTNDAATKDDLKEAEAALREADRLATFARYASHQRFVEACEAKIEGKTVSHADR